MDAKEIHENKVKVRAIGRLHLLPESLQKAIKELMEATKDYDGYTLNICLAYGGREEIIDGIKEMIKDGVKADDVTEEKFREYLDLDNDPDLVIRTSGEYRLSDFLTWHITYSEYFFVQKHWPEFEKQDLINIIDEFTNKRQRRFGSG